MSGEKVLVEIEPTKCPALDQILDVIRMAILIQHCQPGGPGPEKTMELSVDCKSDPVFRQVLELKGGQLGIVIRLRANVDDVQSFTMQPLESLRMANGIKQGFQS